MASANPVTFVGTFEGNPPPEAFHVETVVDPYTVQDVVGMVRHPGNPYVARQIAGGTSEEDQYRCIGLSYLDALKATLNLPDVQWIHTDIRAALAEDRQPTDRKFGWLAVTWPESNVRRGRKPIGSFWADRGNALERRARPYLLVLLAGCVDTDRQLQAGSDMGLRIVMHVHEEEVRIHGVTLAGLSNRRALQAVPEKRVRDRSIFDFIDEAHGVIGDALNCGKRVWINNLENALQPGTPAGHLIATGYALRFPTKNEIDPLETDPKKKARARARTYDFRVELALGPQDEVKLVRLHRDVYIGAGATLHCFVQDAASHEDIDPSQPPDPLAARRSTLSDERLGVFRDDVYAKLSTSRALTFSDDKLHCFEARAASEHTASRQGGRTVASRKGVVTAGSGNQPVRSDQQAANDAHLRAAEFFARMLTYGFDAEVYFRFARLPLVHRARPAMPWAPDGELPNAEVRPFLDNPDASGNYAKDDAGSDGYVEKRAKDTLQLLVNYGSADPAHRRKLPLRAGVDPDDPAPEGRMKAQYLSVASDPRWAWHEFGHVLNFASTGELEFPFAHSAGDALAAIASDPISRLATAEDPDAELRHVTYPWIEVPGRSHGRSALRGYGWCGCRNLTRLNFTGSLERYHHTYFGEQIMSSSLFRLYRSLGGDTRSTGGVQVAGDEETRLSASDYCIYLIMRAISLLGSDTLAPARTADQFVSALIEADLGTGDWTLVDVVWPFNRDTRKEVKRQGGRIHKVIRWAFEQQGLYATDNPRLTSEALGKPPRVDIFIADRRRCDGNSGDGGYAPVPLRCSDDEPWHAHGGSLERQDRQVTVRVGNRGDQPAVRTGVRAWWARPSDNNMEWQPMAAPLPCDIAGNGGGSVQFQLELPPEAGIGAVWVFVSADASADPSNLAADAEPPQSQPELLELVAHDNNLGLALLPP